MLPETSPMRAVLPAGIPALGHDSDKGRSATSRTERESTGCHTWHALRGTARRHGKLPADPHRPALARPRRPGGITCPAPTQPHLPRQDRREPARWPDRGRDPPRSAPGQPARSPRPSALVRCVGPARPHLCPRSEPLGPRPHSCRSRLRRGSDPDCLQSTRPCRGALRLRYFQGYCSQLPGYAVGPPRIR